MNGQTLAQIEQGLMDDGMTAYVPGVNCLHCGRFVGRDGHISVEHFEMSSTVASVEGECRRCIDRHAELVPLALAAYQQAHDLPGRDGWLTDVNVRNIIQNGGYPNPSLDEVQRARWSIMSQLETGVFEGHLAHRVKPCSGDAAHTETLA